MNSVFCCFSLEKLTECSQNPGLVNQFSATPRGQLMQKECGKRSSITFFVFGTLSVTFRSLFLTLLSLFSSLFCQTPFAGLLLRQGELNWTGPIANGSDRFCNCWTIFRQIWVPLTGLEPQETIFGTNFGQIFKGAQSHEVQIVN